MCIAQVLPDPWVLFVSIFYCKIAKFVIYVLDWPYIIIASLTGLHILIRTHFWCWCSSFSTSNWCLEITEILWSYSQFVWWVILFTSNMTLIFFFFSIWSYHFCLVSNKTKQNKLNVWAMTSNAHFPRISKWVKITHMHKKYCWWHVVSLLCISTVQIELQS